MSDISKIQLPDNSEYDIKDTVARARISDDLITVEGNPISFETYSAQNAKQTVLTMEPIQNLNGYDKPWVAGQSEQLLDESTIESGTIDQTTGQDAPSSGVKRCDYMPTKGATNLFLSSNGSMRFFWYDSSKNYLSNDAVNKNTSVTVPNNTAYFRIIGLAELFDRWTMINSGTTAKTYCPYSNICPISGRMQAEIDGCGKNLAKPIRTVGETWSSRGVDYVCNADYSISMSGSYTGTAFGQQQATSVILPPGTYIFNGQNGVDSTNKKATLQLYDAETNSQLVNRDTAADYEFTLTKPTEIWINIGMRVDFASVSQITMSPMIRRVGEDATYEPYIQGDSVTRNYGQTVYGGSDNVETGALIVDIMRVELATLNWNATTSNGIFYADDDLSEFIGVGRTIIACDSLESVDNVSGLGGARTNPNCSICGYSGSGTHRFYIRWDAKGTSVSDLVSALNGVYACYKLATPQTTTLTAAQVNLIKGINNISTDADQITLTYREGEFATLSDLQDRKYIYTATCTTSGGTKDKVVTVSEDQNFVLQVGAMVAVKFSNTNTYSATSSNHITLNVNSTGALDIWYGNSNVNTGTNTIAYGTANYYNYYMYDGMYWVWSGISAESDSGNYSLRYYSNILAGTDDIVYANLICADSTNKYYHLKKGTPFDIRWPIMCAASNIAANATGNNNYILVTMSIAPTQSLTLTAYKPLYIKGTLSGTTFTPVSTAPITQTVPTAEDGYYYLYLGVAISTTVFYLLDYHPIYVYVSGAFKIYDQSFAVNKNLQDVDLNTVKETGFYYAGGNNGCSNMPSGYTQASGFGLIVEKTAKTDHLVQIYSSTSNNMLSRVCSNGTWSAWVRFNDRVYQSVTTAANWRKVVLSAQNDVDPETAVSATSEQVHLTPKVEVQASTGTLRSNILTSKTSVNIGNGAASMQYNSNTQSIDFVFPS